MTCAAIGLRAACVPRAHGALVRRRDTGQGGVVDVSLFETALGFMGLPIANYFANGAIPPRTGSDCSSRSAKSPPPVARGLTST